MEDALGLAKELLNTVTPMKADCGKVCGAACCTSLEGEETGMLLFPGEEKEYDGLPDWRIVRADGRTLVICPGKCDRNRRPLSCRIFPLLPVIRNGEIRAVTDLRAKAVCPLARQGISAVDPAFSGCVAQVGAILMKDAIQRSFLEQLTAEQTELREIRKRFGRQEDV